MADSGKTCSASATPTLPCLEPVVVKVSLAAPGGTVSGRACRKHPEVVRQMVRDEVARLFAAARV